MKRRARSPFLAILAILVVASAACSLVFDTDILVSNQDAGADTGTSDPIDATTPPRSDAPEDAPPNDDAALVDVITTPPEAPFFIDDFARPNSPEVGNGWTEKNSVAFVLDTQSALKQQSTTRYRDNLVYRPEISELDVEVAGTFKVIAAPPGSPQVHARITPGTVAALDALDSYLVYVEDGSSTRVSLARQRGGGYSTRLGDPTNTGQTFVLSEPIAAGATYRLRLRVQGAGATIYVACAFDKLVAAPGTFATLGQAAVSEKSDERLTTPGHVGFSGDQSSDKRFAYVRFEASRVK